MKRAFVLLLGIAAIAASASRGHGRARRRRAHLHERRRADHVRQVRELPSQGRGGADDAHVVRGRAAVGEGDQEQGRGARDAAVGRRPGAHAEDAQRSQPVAGADRHDRGVGRRRRAEGQRRRSAAGCRSSPKGWTAGREPDAILEMPVEFSIPAEGELGVQMFYSKVPWSEDRFAETLEIRPGNRAVVHHAGVFVVDIPEGAKIVDGRLVMPDGKASTDRGAGAAGRADDTALPGANKLLSWVPGRGVDSHRADIGKRIPAGKYINWQVHYNPTGKPEKDRTRLGIWFNKVAGDARAADPSGRRSAGDDEGRPVAVSRRGQGSRVHGGRGQHAPPQQDAEHSAVRRGRGRSPASRRSPRTSRSTRCRRTCTCAARACKWVIVYPDGREQTILDVPKFDFNWQIQYELEQPLHIPAGSKILGIGVLRQLAEEQMEPGAREGSVLVGAELGRDVPAVHRVLRRQPGPQRDDRDQVAAEAAVAGVSRQSQSVAAVITVHAGAPGARAPRRSSSPRRRARRRCAPRDRSAASSAATSR